MEVLSVMESLTSSYTPLTELEGVSERMVEKLREAGIENVERILEIGIEKLQEIPGVGEKTAAKIMEAARDLFEEVEIEVPEGIELPTAITAVAPPADAPVDAPADVPAAEPPSPVSEEPAAAAPSGDAVEGEGEGMQQAAPPALPADEK